MKFKQWLLGAALCSVFSFAATAADAPDNGLAVLGWSEATLVADRDDRKDRRDERGRADERQEKRDCRQEEGRVGKDKRECKQDEVRDGVRGQKDDDDKEEDA
ncbi:MAG: hypothetical protein OEU90_12570 [Gammaproteobacteria bacterium]|nr:hypothetical protein [Gammaproteobacteria bacterium]MDH3751391.1 hypothetical protein [Gammaproteobacteria bacterium]MDH3806289.1 hypothetical protein [Gammaproteobacteria bacterium]